VAAITIFGERSFFACSFVCATCFAPVLCHEYFSPDLSTTSLLLTLDWRLVDKTAGFFDKPDAAADVASG